MYSVVWGDVGVVGYIIRNISSILNALVQLVEALRYKPEGPGFDSR